MAERELSSFFQAVARMFGPEQARLSAQDWLRELSAAQPAPVSVRDWHEFTTTVSTRLATRVSTSHLQTEFTAA